MRRGGTENEGRLIILDLGRLLGTDAPAARALVLCRGWECAGVLLGEVDALARALLPRAAAQEATKQ